MTTINKCDPEYMNLLNIVYKHAERVAQRTPPRNFTCRNSRLSLAEIQRPTHKLEEYRDSESLTTSQNRPQYTPQHHLTRDKAHFCR